MNLTTCLRNMLAGAFILLAALSMPVEAMKDVPNKSNSDGTLTEEAREQRRQLEEIRDRLRAELGSYAEEKGPPNQDGAREDAADSEQDTESPQEAVRDRGSESPQAAEDPEERLEPEKTEVPTRTVKGRDGDKLLQIREEVDRDVKRMEAELKQRPEFNLKDVAVAPAVLPEAAETGDGSLTYRGAFAEGRMHGRGRVTYPDGGIYTGRWRDGVRQGQGELNHPDGWVFVGDWEGGPLTGRGFLADDSGWQYNGNWKEGRMHGTGILQHPEGWTYTGQWVNGRREGTGEVTYRDGRYYKGRWEDGLRSGEGTLRHSDGRLVDKTERKTQ